MPNVYKKKIAIILCYDTREIDDSFRKMQIVLNVEFDVVIKI